MAAELCGGALRSAAALLQHRGTLLRHRDASWLSMPHFLRSSTSLADRAFSAASDDTDASAVSPSQQQRHHSTEPRQKWRPLPGPPKIPLKPSSPEPPQLWGGPPAVERRVFCNRSLNMASISAVGFDMDYTLAQYNPEAFEALVYKLTVEKLVGAFEYPKELLLSLSFGFNCHYMARGLLVDKQRGNILKVDRHGYAKVAYHGFRELTTEERQETYNNRASVRDEALVGNSNYMMIDTLFSLAEAYLFMQLVEVKDKQPDAVLKGKTYFDMATDIRRSVDLCHRDGSLKQEVAGNPQEYIHRDPALVPLLKQLRAAGHKVFLATNSLWDYTDVVMKFLMPDERPDAWLEYFDVVLTGTHKPRFFTEQRPLFEVDLPTGMLRNTESGSPMVPIGEEEVPAAAKLQGSALGESSRSTDEGQACKARVFQGGSYRDLHRMLSIESGTEVLYVGDHIFGDILTSKKEAGWRTMFILPELENELQILKWQSNAAQELVSLRRQRAAIEDQIECLEWQLQHSREPPPDHHAGHQHGSREVVSQLKELVSSLAKVHHSKLSRFHRDHHRVWGQLLKAGYQKSHFAYQIDKHACLYTSHIANMLFYSPMKNFRGRVDRLPHEEELSVEICPNRAVRVHD